MKKTRSLLLIMIFTFTACIFKVHAASMSISASSATVTVGSTVTIYPKVNGLAGSFSISSSNSSVLSGGGSGWCEDSGCSNGLSSTMYFKATKIGTATITFSTIDVSIDDGNNGGEYSNSRSITINVVEKKSGGNSGNGNSGNNKPIDINKTYSKDNYLNFLDVENYDITPKFDKDTLEYKLDLNNDVSKINIKAED